MVAIIIVSVVLGLLLLFFLGGAIVGYIFTFYHKPDLDKQTYNVLTGEQYDDYHDELVAVIVKAVEIPFERVTIKSHDGLTLAGRLYVQDATKPFHLQINGYKGYSVRDFASGLLLALNEGHNVLLVDQRAHGYSSGHTISFGIKERDDVLSWSKYIAERFGDEVKIFIEGISMGATTVLMASNLEIPNLVGVISDSPYNSVKEITYRVAKYYLKIPAFIAHPAIYWGAVLFGHFNINQFTCEDCVKDCKVPILIIHGTADKLAPIEMSKSIQSAGNDVTLVEIEGSVHGIGFFIDNKKYVESVQQFFKKCLS